MKGPKTVIPHSPKTTLGMPASSSRKRESIAWARRGIHSLSISTPPTEMGTARPMAMTEVARVPSMRGSGNAVVDDRRGVVEMAEAEGAAGEEARPAEDDGRQRRDHHDGDDEGERSHRDRRRDPGGPAEGAVSGAQIAAREPAAGPGRAGASCPGPAANQHHGWGWPGSGPLNWSPALWPRRPW